MRYSHSYTMCGNGWSKWAGWRWLAFKKARRDQVWSKHHIEIRKSWGLVFFGLYFNVETRKHYFPGEGQ